MFHSLNVAVMKSPKPGLTAQGLNRCLHLADAEKQGFQARTGKPVSRITPHGFSSYPDVSQALALHVSRMSCFLLSHQVSARYYCAHFTEGETEAQRD